MTDADWDFSSVWADVRRSMRNGKCGEFILVGIGYDRGEDGRGRDYTPTRDIKWEREEYGDDGGLISGGAATFLDFMDKELFPFLKANYRVKAGREGRCLARHSLGGLPALCASVQRPDLFSSIVASSPTITWDSRIAFGFLDAFIADPSVKEDTFVYASIDSQEGFPNDVLLDEWMKRMKSIPSFTTDQRYFPNTVHSQVQTVSLPAGLEASFVKELQ